MKVLRSWKDNPIIRGSRIMRATLLRKLRSRMIAKRAMRTMCGFVVTLVWLFLAAQMLSLLYLPARIVIWTVAVAIMSIMLILPWIPGAVPYLSNDPNRFADSVEPEDRMKGKFPVYTFGFFTGLSPDRAKIIELVGGRFVRAIMRLDGYTFRGEVEPGIRMNQEIYWDVVRTPPGRHDAHPFPDRGLLSWINPFWWWCRYVYDITGGVFVGVPKFRIVRVFQFTRMEKVPQEGGGFVLVPRTDWSDHYRVADDQTFAEVQDADTRDKLPVDVQKAITLRCINPYKTAYNTSANFGIRMLTAIGDAINAFTRGHTADEVISITEGGKTTDFGKAIVKQLNGKSRSNIGVPSFSNFGLHVVESALLKNKLDKETQDRLKDEALAQVDARARAKRGKGEAEAAGHLMDAVKQRGERGAEVFRTEASVRRAEAVGKAGGTLIMDEGSKRGAVSPGVEFLRRSMEGETA